MISYDTCLTLKEYGYKFKTNIYYRRGSCTYDKLYKTYALFFAFTNSVGDVMYIDMSSGTKVSRYHASKTREWIAVPGALELIKIIIRDTKIPLSEELLNMGQQTLAELIIKEIGPLKMEISEKN